MNVTFVQNVTGRLRRRPRAPKIEDHQWAFYHDEIRTKYVDENLTLEELIEYMSITHRFLASKKQYTTYLNKHKIRKSDRFSPLNLNSPSPNSLVDRRPSDSSFEEGNQSHLPYSSPVLDETTSDFDLDETSPRSDSALERVEPSPEGASAQHSLSGIYEDFLNEHALNAISGTEDRERQYENDPLFIRRTADAALFFLEHHSPQQFHQLFDRLHGIILSRPMDLHCHDYDVLGLLHLACPLVHGRSNHFRRLSCRASLLICSFWKLDYDISSRGRVLLRLIAMSLLYCSGKHIAADDLLRRPDTLRHTGTPPAYTFADHLHENCYRFINACNKVTSEADWSHMLLGLRLDQSHWGWQELQTEHVALFVLPAHIDGLSMILRWCITVLNGHGFRYLRREVLDFWCSIQNGGGDMNYNDMVAVERYALHYYFISSFWRLRGRATSTLTMLDPNDTAIFSIFRMFLDDFGLSEFDILQRLVEVFISELISQDPMNARLPYEPHYLNPEVLSRLYHTFSDREDTENCKEVANWWLNCWLWDKKFPETSDFRQTALAARLGNHVLESMAQSLEEAHPSNMNFARTGQHPADVQVLPTLYEGVAGSRQVGLSGPGVERNSYNMTSSLTFPQSQDQRFSGVSSDYANFSMAGEVSNVSPPERSPTPPSEGFPDLREVGSDVSRRWRFSGSSNGTWSSGRSGGGHTSRSRFGIRSYISATFSRHRRTTSRELVEEDAKMEDFLHHDQRCMSPSENGSMT